MVGVPSILKFLGEFYALFFCRGKKNSKNFLEETWQWLAEFLSIPSEEAFASREPQ